ncbi:UvrD-helicase domain-containing protein [Halomonas qaidamensis]|uniref:DNA 3'-5' helicase n=1 Tax=Halomonas qaidamensis TaxID=2866211 RepID=A0ABY6JP52_9GAMM|nr:UvrD-helicase domain-containing protein [Halomonas qaidamensis]UYV18966.1 UvrD-helicase domain-containing protein [Halomonas qaidamensis]
MLEEPRRYSDFFASVAASPLTEEQTAAAVCFEDRLLLVAAAGSGKTQTMVARAGYAVLSGQARPEEIVMLAFNKDAALELDERVKTRLLPAIEGADAITCTTFHSLALRIIGESTGRKPSVGSQLDKGQDIGVVAHILSQLIAESNSYRAMWFLYSIVLGHSAGEYEKAASDEAKPQLTITDPDAIITQRGEVVRSQEERIIADWLSLHGINYRYEATYPHPTADEHHRDYRPDFYYPEIDLYHEHFALDARGQPPARFKGYLDGVEWKRVLHHQHQTALFETTSYGLRQGDDLERLKAELSARGLNPVANANNLVNPTDPVEVPEFAKLARMFIIRYKGQMLNVDALRTSLDERPFPVRDRQFLNLFEPILERWNQRLADEGAVDYEDMLNQAAKHLENGEWQSPFRTIMVDEFQDTSPARANIIRGLAGENVTLAAVGDDFQSIYRFAGADIRNMTQFEQRFGKARTLYLTKTFRSPQSLNDLASAFVTRNPDQLNKSVFSANSASGPRVHFRAYAHGAAQSSLDDQLDKLAVQARKQHVSLSVFLLGRYKHDRPGNLSAIKRRHHGALDIRFLTVHASKGLEADYVFLLNVHNTELGFPMRRPEDELLGFVMPPDEAYEHAEERRLLYVAITRAKRQAVLVAEEGRISDFVFELSDLGMGAILDHRRLVEITPCPACEDGRLIPKITTRGESISCSQHPHCVYKPL